MDENIRKLLEKKKMQELQKMEAMGQEEDLSEVDMEGLDITKRLAEGQEKQRLKDIEDRAAAKKMQEELDAAREAQGQEDYEKKLKEARREEYNKEIATKGYADKSDYPDLFPEVEINPRDEEERRKKQMYR
jgi:hypothetical protein